MTFTPAMIARARKGQTVQLKPGCHLANHYGTWTFPHAFKIDSFSHGHIVLQDKTGPFKFALADGMFEELLEIAEGV